MSRKATKEYIGMKGRAYKAASRLLRNIHDLFPEAELSRSRAYHSNDNAHVEEKNRHVGRELFGERRLDCRDLESDLIRLCDMWSDYRNFFCPSKRQSRK